jgi:hypothetical protein
MKAFGVSLRWRLVHLGIAKIANLTSTSGTPLGLSRQYQPTPRKSNPIVNIEINGSYRILIGIVCLDGCHESHTTNNANASTALALRLVLVPILVLALVLLAQALALALAQKTHF